MPNSPPDLPAPGLLRRLAAITYDTLLLLGLWFAVAALLLAASGGQLAAAGRPEWLMLILRAALLLATYLFFASFWIRGGQTLGMRAWRLRLVAADGAPVSIAQTARRFLAAGLSLIAFGLGFLWVLVDREKLAWHDRLSGTRLVVLPRTA